MKRSLFGIFFGLIVILASAGASQAQMCGCMGQEDNGMMMGGMGHQMGMMGDEHPMLKHLMALGLSDKQRDAAKALHEKMLKEMVKKKADAEIASIELRDLLDKDPVDMKAVEAAVKKSESVRTEMFLTHIKAHEEMKSLLTPEQRKKLKDIMEGRGGGCSMMGGESGYMDMPMREHMH